MSEEARATRLGRGLSALLGDDDPDHMPLDQVRGLKHVPIEFIKPSPLQPRRRFDNDELENLAASIREKGVLQPIIVRPDPARPNGYEIVAGERRWRASQRAQLHEVPVIVKELNDGQVLEIAIIENVQRADLNPIEEAQGYTQLIEKFGHTQEKLATLIGKSRSHVANTIRLLALPDKVRTMLVDGRLTAGHARALVATPDAESLAEKIHSLQMTVREAEALARKAEKKGDRPARAPAAKDADTAALEDNLMAALGMHVSINDRGEKGGEVRVAYKTLDQLDEICRRLKRS